MVVVGQWGRFSFRYLSPTTTKGGTIMANERLLIAAAIQRGWLDAQSETPGVALPARRWLLNGANGWLDELGVYHITRLVGSLDPLPQASFYEMAWDDWQPEPMTMTYPTTEVMEPEPVALKEPEPEPDPLPVMSMSCTDTMVAHVRGWAMQGELGR